MALANYAGLPITGKRIEDWIEIHDLVMKYNYAMDDEDAELFASLWHPDAIWDIRVSAEKEKGPDFGYHSGKDAIVTFGTGRWAKRNTMHHLLTDVLIWFHDENTASGRSVNYAQTVELDLTSLLPLIPRYRDKYVKHEGRWVILERVVRTEYRGVRRLKPEDSVLSEPIMSTKFTLTTPT